jgi:hypothetical protein
MPEICASEFSISVQIIGQEKATTFLGEEGEDLIMHLDIF